jgi:putative DNA primase/helicase
MTEQELIAAFEAELHCAGIIPGEIIADGELHRCGTEGKAQGKDGAYLLHRDPPVSGWWQNFRTGESDTWTAGDSSTMTEVERQSLKARIERDRAARKEGQARRYAEARAKAAEVLSGLPEVQDGNPYLTAKGVRAVARLRADGDTLVVPVLGVDGQPQTLQFIHADGSKLFLPGGQVAGGFFPIKGDNGPLYLVEGLATGLSVREATGATVLCAFNAGNLAPVAELARKTYPDREIIVAGDNDTKTEGNPGRTKAEAAAQAVGGKWVVPLFEDRPDLTDFNDLHQLAGLDAVRDQLARCNGPRPAEDRQLNEDEYPAPVHLDDVVLPQLEPKMIPGPLARMCQEVAEALQVPLELPLTAALAAVATAVQGKARVQVKPGYSEPLNLFQCAALPPGQRKSGVVEIFKRPLVQWEKDRRTEMIEAVRVAKSERATLEQAINAKRKRIASAKTAEDRRAVLDEVRQLEAELPEIPTIPRLLADDVTPEAMAEIMEPQGGRIAIIEAEGGILDTLAGRYSKGVANLDLVLKSWGQESVHVDRRGRDPIVLESPTLTLALCPQPSVISALGENSTMRGRGLVGRMLFWLPKSLLGSRGQTRAVSQTIEADYNRMIRNLLNLPARIGEDGQDTHHLIHLNPEALNVLEDFAAAVEKELGPGGEFADMTDWAGKLPGQAVRLAGLFHCSYCERPWDLQIEKDVMLAATNLASILVEHAKAALDLMGVDPRTECAKKIWAWLEREGVERFTGRDALKRVRGTFPTMKEVNPGLDVLEEYGLIIKRPKEHKSQPYAVNPKVRKD